MNAIEKMERHIEELRALLEEFDLDVHNDEDNEGTLNDAKHALDDLDGCVGDLIP